MKRRMRHLAGLAAIAAAALIWRAGAPMGAVAPAGTESVPASAPLPAAGGAPAPPPPPSRPAESYLRAFAAAGSSRVHSSAFGGLHGPDRKRNQPVTIELPGLTLRGRVDSVLRADGLSSYGVLLDDGSGRLTVALRDDGAVLAPLLFFGESRAFLIRGEGPGAWFMEATTLDHVYCALPGQVYPALDGAGIEKDPTPPPPPPLRSAAKSLSGPPSLNSRPGARFVIYCDFDGERIEHPFWNFGRPIDAQPAPRADDADWVTSVWRRTAEDFAPFAVNVTTDRAVFEAARRDRRVHAVVTPTTTAAPGSGGVAFLFSFRFGIPCWVFNLSEYSAADTLSHEVGHTLGLFHDGRRLPDRTRDVYYGGHGQGATSWAPIMGAPWSDEDGSLQYNEVTQWSRGDYAYADRRWQDDLAFITSDLNGFGYARDLVGDRILLASELQVEGGRIIDEGIIEQRRDRDVFRFRTGGGEVWVQAEPLDVASPDAGAGSETRGANLAVALTLFDRRGRPMESAAPPEALGAEIRRVLPAGTYYVGVEGAGRGAADDGFSDYASLGRYRLTGWIPAAVAGPGIMVWKLAPSGAGGHEALALPAAEGAVEFGAVTLGGRAYRDIDIENTGSRVLSLGAITIDSGHFAPAGPLPVTVPPGGTARVRVYFAPSAEGLHTARLSIPSNDPEWGRYSVALRGQGGWGPGDGGRAGTPHPGSGTAEE